MRGPTRILVIAPAVPRASQSTLSARRAALCYPNRSYRRRLPIPPFDHLMTWRIGPLNPELSLVVRRLRKSKA